MNFDGAARAAEQLSAGEVSATELSQAYLARIEAHDAAINAYTHVMADEALAAAEASDKRRAAGAPLSGLDGVPLAVKDNIDVKGVPTTAGIEARRNKMAGDDAHVVETLRRAGAVILGKTNMHEGALGILTDNAAFGRCHNPYRRDWTPGGSSGGSGAAVAAALCAGALGTDTMGSVRIPAAYCGLVGHKPTRGLISIRNVVPLSWTLDHVGPIGRSVADVALMLQNLVRFDPKDPFAVPTPDGFDVFAGAQWFGKPSIRGLRLGVVDVDSWRGINPSVIEARNKAIHVWADQGASIDDVHLLDFEVDEVSRAGLLLAEAEAAAFHGPDLDANPDGFTEGFRKMLEFGRNQTAARLAEAGLVAGQVKSVARYALEGLDALIFPATPDPVFPFDDIPSPNQGLFTGFANFAGLPSLCLPTGLDERGMPQSVQIVGRPFADAQVLTIAAAYEAVAGHELWPEEFDPR